MNNLDYTSGNALSRYPFKDTSPLTWIANNGSSPSAGAIPNTVFLDAKFVPKAVLDQFYIEMLRITYLFDDFDNPLSTDWFDLSFYLGDGADDTEFTVRIYYGQDHVEAVSPGGTLMHFEIDTVALYAHIWDIQDVNYDTLFFDSGNTFCMSTITFPAPLTSITFSNQLDSATQDILTTKTSGTLKFEEGTNINLDGDTALNIDLVPGGGTGLFDACVELGNVVRTINGIASDGFNNFALSKDACYELTPGTHSITISNRCKPECSEEELKNFANYMNRVKDGVVSVTEIVTELKDKYDELVAKYVSVVEDTKKVKPVFIKAEASRTANKVYDFSTITAGIYSPNKSAVAPVSLAVLYHPHIYTYVDKTSYLNQKSSKVLLPAPGFTGQSMQCNDVIYSGFVLAARKIGKLESRVNLGEPEYDVQLSLGAGANNNGYAVVPLLCGSPNFGLNYSSLKDTGNNVTTIKITAYPFTQTGGAVPVALNFECSPNMVFKKGSYTSGSGAEVLITDRFGFTANLDLTKNTICQMEYQVLGASLNLDFNVKLETAAGSAIKTIPFNV